MKLTTLPLLLLSLVLVSCALQESDELNANYLSERPVPIMISDQNLAAMSAYFCNGDADYDGDVDGMDFLAWQRSYKKPTYNPLTDFNGDGENDSLDLAIWQDNYGCDL